MSGYLEGVSSKNEQNKPVTEDNCQYMWKIINFRRIRILEVWFHHRELDF